MDELSKVNFNALSAFQKKIISHGTAYFLGILKYGMPNVEFSVWSSDSRIDV